MDAVGLRNPPPPTHLSVQSTVCCTTVYITTFRIASYSHIHIHTKWCAFLWYLLVILWSFLLPFKQFLYSWTVCPVLLFARVIDILNSRKWTGVTHIHILCVNNFTGSQYMYHMYNCMLLHAACCYVTVCRQIACLM